MSMHPVSDKFPSFAFPHACVLATAVASVTCALAAGSVRAQQPSGADREGQVQPRGGRGDRENGQRGGLIAQMTAFKTDVPGPKDGHEFDIVLVRPTRSTMSASVVSAAEVVGLIEYSRAEYSILQRTPIQHLKPGEPALFPMSAGLEPDGTVFYTWVYADPANRAALEHDAPGNRSPLVKRGTPVLFNTVKTPGHSFSFVIQADSHLDQGVEPKVYEQTLTNMLPPIAPTRPDFMIDLGDTFMTDKRGRDFKAALPQYDAQRYYFSRVAHSVPLFMVLGNHDGEKGTSGTGADDIGPWSYAQRTSRFPQPVTGAGSLHAGVVEGTFYTGSTEMKDGVGSNYYAFEWGDAIFIVLDPYWSTTERIHGGGGGNRGAGGGGAQGGQGGQRPSDEPLRPTDGSWTSTLGRTQYDWLTQTLEGTKAKYRFVFIHHLVGGLGGAESRGGVESSPYFEWGGKNADGSPGFAQHRAGWAMPIHDLLVKHDVLAVFHGHDHLYVNSQRDGVVYQCVPQPGNPRGNTRTAKQYGYTSGTVHGSPGHVRVRVEADKATVEFVRTALAGAVEPRPGERGAGGSNGAIVHEYRFTPVSAK